MALPHFSHWCMNYSSVWCVAANSQQSSSDSLKLSNCFCHTAFVISKASHWPLLVRKKQQTSETTWPHMTMHHHPCTISWGRFGSLAESLERGSIHATSQVTSQPCWSNPIKFSNSLALCRFLSIYLVFFILAHSSIGKCKLWISFHSFTNWLSQTIWVLCKMSLKNESFLPPVVYVQVLSGLNFGSPFQAFSGEAWRRPEHTSDSWDVRLFYTTWGHKHDIYVYIYIHTRDFIHI